MISTGKIIMMFFLLVGVVILIRLVIWNKSDDEKDTDIADADDLFQTFATNSISAQQNFSNKKLLVKGEIAQVSIDHQYNTVIHLRTNTPGAYITCILEQKEVVANTGTKITISGTYKVFNSAVPDTDFMGEVILSNCYLI